jgi:Uncharacterized protein conserved in bacteria (DUF2188)
VAEGFVHTVYKNDQWVNEIELGDEVSRHATKEEAVDSGRNLARQRKTEHVIHNQDGEIAERSSYGNDPPDRPG